MILPPFRTFCAAFLPECLRKETHGSLSEQGMPFENRKPRARMLQMLRFQSWDTPRDMRWTVTYPYIFNFGTAHDAGMHKRVRLKINKARSAHRKTFLPGHESRLPDPGRDDIGHRFSLIFLKHWKY